MNIYSKVEPGLLLHIIQWDDDRDGERQELVPASQFIQCAALNLSTGTTFRPHKHIIRPVTHELYIPQESWVVISGIVIVTYYDIDDTEIAKCTLFPGDISITLRGGHNYFVHKHAKVYEFKTGPYLGQLLDKTFIDV
jgi:hypothetical protein